MEGAMAVGAYSVFVTKALTATEGYSSEGLLGTQYMCKWTGACNNSQVIFYFGLKHWFTVGPFVLGISTHRPTS